MKKCKFLSFVLCVCFLFLSACSSTVSDPSKTGGEEGLSNGTNTSEKTSHLTLYAPPPLNSLFSSAVRDFEKQFPEVEVELVEFGSLLEAQSYTDFAVALQNDLAAGKGPDVVVWSSEIPDINKTVQSDIFVDLNPYLESDSDFLMEDFVQGVMDAGLFGDKRFFLPLAYEASFLISTQEAMDEAGVHLSSESTLEEWCDELLSYQQRFQSSGSKFVDMEGAQNETVLLTYSAIQCIDYENGEVLIRSDEFRKLMDMNRALYNMSEETYSPDWLFSSITGDAVWAVRNGETLFTEASTYFAFVEDYSGLLEKDTPVYFPFPNVMGEGAVAEVSYSAAIPKHSENKDNAYEFIKILLSSRQQSNEMNFMAVYPVRIQSLKSRVENYVDKLIRNFSSDEEGWIMFQEIPQDILDQYISDVISVTYVNKNASKLIDFVREAMRPYFTGDKSYESCLDELVNKLELYVYE